MAPTPDASFDDLFSRLSSLTNYERRRPDAPYRLGLEGMEQMLEGLGRPDRGLGPAVQIGGSKGKGMTAHLLAGLCEAAGLRTGLYTSPHVRSLFERIRVGLEEQGEEVLRAPLQRVVAQLGEGSTWFEAWTCLAVEVFAQAEVDVVLLEVGLGGRLDTTTAIAKQLCAISALELEHTQILGDTIEAIAREKAGLLRPGVPCLLGAEGPGAEVVEVRARELGAPLHRPGHGVELRRRARDPRGSLLEIRVDGEARELLLPLHTDGQLRSFWLALELFALLRPGELPALLERDLGPWIGRALPPGRFQLLSTEPPILVDGAHTDASLSALAEDLAALFPGRRFGTVLGIAQGKRWERGSGALAERSDRAWVAPLVGKPSLEPGILGTFFAERAVPTELCDGITEATRRAMEALDSGEIDGLLVTGSMYAAGEGLDVLAQA